MTFEEYKNEKVICIGTINFEDNINEQEFEDEKYRFNSKRIGVCKVEVYAGEGQMPHMHVFNINKTFEACICIYSNHYFAHGGKYNDKFSSKQCKEFNKWMNQINVKTATGLTNWQVCYSLWEVFNPTCKYPDRLKIKVQPNYEDMVNFKTK